VFIVTGSGRSGTSAVARVLHESGISMGRHLIGEASFNRTGFYEERPVVDLNYKIMERCGLRVSRGFIARARRKLSALAGATSTPELPAKVPSREEVISAGEPHAQVMRELAAGVPSPGGWKDPSFAWTLEPWLPHLPEPPRLIVCLRGPEAVAQSALDIYGVVDEERKQTHVRRWAAQYERLMDVIDDHKLDAVCVEYDDVVTDTAPTIARLSEFVGRPLDPQYVEPSLRHHRSEVTPEYADLYERVRALSRTPPAATG
jgi:hypothetical protein